MFLVKNKVSGEEITRATSLEEVRMIAPNDKMTVFYGNEGNELAEPTIIDVDVVALDGASEKALIQNAVTKGFTGEETDRAKIKLALSLTGKTSNALSAALNIHMKVYTRLAQAQSLADVRDAVAPAMPLMQSVGELLKNDELMTVQDAQGKSDEDAVIEGLMAMTQAAEIVQSQTTA